MEAAVAVRVRSIDQALVVVLARSIVAAVGAASFVRFATDLLHQANQAVVEEAAAYRIRPAAEEEEGSHSFRAASAACYHAL